MITSSPGVSVSTRLQVFEHLCCPSAELTFAGLLWLVPVRLATRGLQFQVFEPSPTLGVLPKGTGDR